MAYPKLILLAVLALLWQPRVQASPLTQEMALHAMLESVSSALTTMGDYSSLNPDGISNGSARIGAAGLSWTGSVDDQGWTYSGSGMFGGMALSMSLSGLVSGADGSDISFTIAGSGTLGTQPLLMDGTSIWRYDSVLDDYFDSDFAEHTKIGASSWHGWGVHRRRVWCAIPDTVNGSAIIADIIAGGQVLMSDASSGKKVRYGGGMKYCYYPFPFGLQSVASSGKMGSLVAGAALKSALAPAAGAPPAFPTPIANFLDASNLGSVVQPGGGLDGDDVDNRYRSSGRFIGNSFSGLTQDVPEPGSAALALLALTAAAVVCRRRAPNRQA